MGIDLIPEYTFLGKATEQRFFYILQDLENENSQPLEQVSIDEILELQHEEQQQKQEEDERKKKALSDRGIFLHADVQDDYF